VKKRFKPVKEFAFQKNCEQIIDPVFKSGTMVKSGAIVKSKAIVKKGKGLIKVALVYPNTYAAGMSSLGFQTVYKLANQVEFVSCERVFWSRQKNDIQHPKSIETRLNLNKFDIIMFSISFENDFLNLIQLLAQAGIPLRSSDRNHIHPLVVAGGVACFLNPEPIAPFIDCFLLGEAECLLQPFFDAFIKMSDKQSFLQNLEKKVPGSYVPGSYLPGFTSKKDLSINVQYLENLQTITTSSCVLTSNTAFKDTFLIETLKGCPHGCRFCSAGFIYRPPRIYPKKNIFAAIDNAVDKTDRIGFVSSAIADHPDIMNICDYGLKQKFKLSFSSLRADKLNREFILALSKAKVKTATLAPEAGSKRMRRIINKNIKEEDILLAVKKLVNAYIMNLKLYFMIGLPFEHIEDIHDIVKLTKKIKAVFLEESKKNKKIGTITLSINPFIPKPATPFQWAAMEDVKVLKKKIDTIRLGLKNIANININIESIKKARIHALLSQGDQNTADIIESALQDGWASALRKNLVYCDSIIHKEKAVDSPLPWDFLENRVKKEFLVKEFLKAKKEKQSAPCPMIDCSKCKICM
jgi:radical SAM superfamily enzyme YgiQ (UPF0313 family)